jgi:hypothetical protein
MVSAATVGAVLASRRPRHPVGWLLLAFALSLIVNGVAGEYAPYGLQVRPGVLPAAAWVAMPLAPRPPEERYQGVDSPLDLRPFEGTLLLTYRAALAVAVLGLLVGAGSLAVRFRRARGIERQQLRWVVLAAALTGVGMLVALVLVAAGNQDLVGWVSGACMAFLPLATGAAILRYRLYDLDRIISRTLAYGLLTLLLGGGYAAVVLGLGQLLGQDSSLVVAAATLAVAALFHPARRRIQALVDRRFNRRRHDAAQTIEAFSTHLRDELDLDTLSAELLAVVDQAMQPTQVSLWLRPSGNASQNQSTTGASRGAARQPAASSTVYTAL